MNYISLLIITFLITSCCGTKKAIETQPKLAKEVAVVIEDTDTVTNGPTNDDGEIRKIVEVVDNEGNTIAEVSSHEEAEILIKREKSNDSIQYISRGHFSFAHDKWNELLQKNVSKSGAVDYKRFKENRNKLNDYIKSLTETKAIDQWSKEELLAFWINAYNALTIDLILRNYPIESIKDIKDPWDQRLWKFGNKWQNLNDIEHKILREMDEPRIHFAIVCASESCPKLQNEAFTADTLEEQLTNATREFLADTSKNELSENNIKLSKIFKWFKKDFEQNGSLIDFLNKYSDVSISDKAKKSFKDYSWELNN